MPFVKSFYISTCKATNQPLHALVALLPTWWGNPQCGGHGKSRLSKTAFMSWKCQKKNNCYVFHPPIFRSNTKWECVWDVWESFSKSLQRKRVASQYSLHNLPFFFVGFLFFPSFLLQNPSFIGMLASILRLEPGGVPHRIFPFPVPHQGDRRPEHPRARLLRKRRRQGGAHGALPLAHLRIWLRVVSPGVKTTPTTPRGGYMGTPK